MKATINLNIHCLVETLVLTSLYSALLYLGAQLVLILPI